MENQIYILNKWVDLTSYCIIKTNIDINYIYYKIAEY